MDKFNFEKFNERVLGRGFVVAIDGPSGSGKSTLARRVSADLGTNYLDTGAMYRAFAWQVINKFVEPEDEEKVLKLVEDFPLKVVTQPHAPRFLVAGVDVTNQIRTDAVATTASVISSYPRVREVLIAMQRDIINHAGKSGRGIVLEGRDITTVVAPDADVRVLVTASQEVRLARRAREMHGSESKQALAATVENVINRDQRDAATTSFLKPAPGVELLDTSDLDQGQALEALMAIIEAKL